MLAINLTKFKSFNEATLHLSPLTLLIGANASGKSNAIEGIRLLSWLAQGNKLFTIHNNIQDSSKIIRGRLSDIGYCHNELFSIGCTRLEKWNNLNIEIAIRDDELHINNEFIMDNGEKVPLYKTKSPSSGPRTDIVVEYNNFSKGRRKPIIKCVDSLAIFTQLDSPATFANNHKESQRIIPKITKEFQESLGNIVFLDPVPVLMRDSEFTSEKIMRGDGKNISGVLYNLCKYPDTKKQILSIIESLPEQNISDITFYDTSKGRVMLEIEENFGKIRRKWDATMLSDGTMRVLSIAAALLSAQKGSLVVIEEVDNGVHPSRARNLLMSMQKIALERNIKLLLSTHNPALMDAVPDDALGNVVFCYRDNDDGSSKLVRLADVDSFPALVASGSLGQLATRQTIERFAKNKQTSEEKKDKALAWLDAL